VKLDLSRIDLREGDCRDVLRGIPDDSFDSACMDPPYALVSIVKRFGAADAAPAKSEGASGVYKRASSGFMGKTWDTGEVAHDPAFWREVYRVLKPGAHLVAFASTRTYHRLACAIEDAGFEIRDMVDWLYGSGFPKSHDQGEGRGTALKPAKEPCVLARKSLIGTVAENIARFGTGAINIDGCRIHADDAQGGTYTVRRLKPGATLAKTGANCRPEDGVLYHGETKPGRWPANVVHDGSADVLAAFPDTQSGTLTPDMNIAASTGWSGGSQPNRVKSVFLGNEGSAARFFYCAKAGPEDRMGSKHPTVKPVALLRWLVRLITPPGGRVLDCFAGTGTTGLAAFAEGFAATLIERDPEYIADIRARLAYFADGGHRAAVTARHKTKAAGDLPLFQEFGGGSTVAGPAPITAPEAPAVGVDSLAPAAGVVDTVASEAGARAINEDDLLEIPAFLKRDPATGQLLGAAR